MQFNQTIADIRDGALHAQLTEEWTELIASVMQQGKSGTLQLTLKVKPNGDALQVEAFVATKAPKPTVGAAIFYGDENGNLFRRNPRQMDIDDFTKRRVEAEPAAAKTGDAA